MAEEQSKAQQVVNDVARRDREENKYALSKELNGWISTEDEKIACQIEEKLVTIAYKSCFEKKHQMVTVPKSVILEIAERIKSEEAK